MTEGNKQSVVINQSQVFGQEKSQLKKNSTNYKEFFKNEQEKCPDAMKRKLKDLINRAANFLECTRLFSDERLEQLKRVADQEIEQRSFNQTTKSLSSDEFDSKMSTVEDTKAAKRKNSNDIATEKELPIKSYDLKQLQRFETRYAETYDESYSERQKRFKYTFQQVKVKRQLEYERKLKTFWGELKRLLLCYGGTYVDEIPESNRDQNQKNLIGISRKRQPHLRDSNKDNINNIFIEEVYEQLQAPPQEIKLQKRPRKNIRSSAKFINQGQQTKINQHESLRTQGARTKKQPAIRKEVQEKKQDEFEHKDAQTKTIQSQYHNQNQNKYHKREHTEQNLYSDNYSSQNRGNNENKGFHNNNDNIGMDTPANYTNQNSASVNNNISYNNSTGNNINRADSNTDNNTNTNTNINNNKGKTKKKRHQINNIDSNNYNNNNLNTNPDPYHNNPSTNTNKPTNTNLEQMGQMMYNYNYNYNETAQNNKNTIITDPESQPQSNHQKNRKQKHHHKQQQQQQQQNKNQNNNTNTKNYTKETNKDIDVDQNIEQNRNMGTIINMSKHNNGEKVRGIDKNGQHLTHDSNGNHQQINRPINKIQELDQQIINHTIHQDHQHHNHNHQQHQHQHQHQQQSQQPTKYTKNNNKVSKTENINNNSNNNQGQYKAQNGNGDESILSIKYDDDLGRNSNNNSNISSNNSHNPNNNNENDHPISHTPSMKKSKKVRKAFITKTQDNLQTQQITFDGTVIASKTTPTHIDGSGQELSMLNNSVHGNGQVGDDEVYHPGNNHGDHGDFMKKKKNRKKANLVVMGPSIEEEINVDQL